MDQRITMIPIAELRHHPKNPRKEIGDVSDLASSIKEAGIMQNLTVVQDPDYDPDPGQPINRYLVVIGNRRLEAAKAAGLKELPCFVSDMDERTQLTTMLAENMQRADLTITEQIDGIQECLDLGLSDAEIRKKTGLSKTTYSERKKLGKCPKKGTMDAAMRQGFTIKDYLRIADVSKSMQDALYGMIERGSSPYEVRAKLSAVEETERFEKWKKTKWIPYANSINAKEQPCYTQFIWDGKLAFLLGTFSETEGDFNVKIPELLPGETLKWWENQNKILLYRVYAKKDTKEAKASEETAKARLAIKKQRSEALQEEILRTGRIRLEALCAMIEKDPKNFGYRSTRWLEPEEMYKEILEHSESYCLRTNGWAASARKTTEYKRLMISGASFVLDDESSQSDFLAAEYEMLTEAPTLLWFIFEYSWIHTNPNGLYCEWNQDAECQAWSERVSNNKKTSFWEMLEDLCEYKPTEDELALINGTLPCCSMRVSNAEIKNFLERNPEGESA
jgi:ParB/RepB/Spo0J family partition protein